MTRLRTFHGAGSTDSSCPSTRRRTRVRRPPSVGRGSVHHTSSPTKPSHSGCPSCAAASAASMGEGQEPYADVCTFSPTRSGRSQEAVEYPHPEVQCLDGDALVDPVEQGLIVEPLRELQGREP